MSVNKKALAGAGTALVTGAAARIGAAIAETLHQRGCDVILHYNSNIEAAQRLADRLNAARENSASLVSAELSSPAGIELLARKTKSQFERLDILVNAAGVAPAYALVDLPVDKLRFALEVNLTGYFLMAQQAARIMIGIPGMCSTLRPPRRGYGVSLSRLSCRR